MIDALRRRFPAIGDDAAAVACPPGTLLLAADTVVAGVHGDVSRIGLDGLGWRAVVSNVSDIAAMGGEPHHLLVSVAAPSDTDLVPLFDGIAAAAGDHGCEVVGGDLTNAPALVVSIAITGSVAGGAPVLRSGAAEGDALFVTGPLGGAAASGYTLRPRARVDAGRAARLAGATAMIDVSDGLAADVGHLADASGVGLALDEVPVAGGATLDQALHGGDDYELVFAAPAAAGAAVPGCVRIGVCTGDPARRTLGGAPLPPGGWEHRWG